MIGKEAFMNLSRELAQKAQQRESNTIQPKEKLSGIKAILTIKNFLGGNYYFTSDEAEIKDKSIFLIEAKHSKENNIPSTNDIKDGLLKMILFTNLEDVKVDNKRYIPVPILKLTTDNKLDVNILDKNKLELLKKEAETNGFRVLINKVFLF